MTCATAISTVLLPVLLSCAPQQYVYEQGYTATTHKSRGETLRDSFVPLSEDSLLSREIAYVQTTRHQEDIHIYIDRESVRELLQGLRPTPAMVEYAEDPAEDNASNCRRVMTPTSK